MEHIQPIVLQARTLVVDATEKAAPYVAKVVDQAQLAAKPLLPYYRQAKHVVDHHVSTHVRPHLVTVLQHLAPLFLLVAQTRAKLPVFDGVPDNVLGIAVIVLHVLNYNITAQFEYYTGLLSKVCIDSSLSARNVPDIHSIFIANIDRSLARRQSMSTLST